MIEKTQTPRATVDARSQDLAKILKGQPHINITLDPAEVCCLVSHVQLALRHPESAKRFGGAAVVAEAAIRRLIKKLPLAAQPYLEAGFDSGQDVPA